MDRSRQVILPSQWHRPIPNKDRVLVLPNHQVLQSFNGAVVLQDLAEERLKEASWRIAQPWEVRYQLHRLLQQQGIYDPSGQAERLMRTLSGLFSAGTLHHTRHTTTANLEAIGQALLHELHQQRCEHPSRLLWRAAELGGPRISLHLWGYPRIGAAELAFVNSLAGEGSLVELPYMDPYWFSENLRSAQQLEQLGWSMSEPITTGERGAGAELWRRGGWEAYGYTDQESEVRGILAQVMRSVERGRKAVVVTRQQELYQNLLQAVSNEYQLPIAMPLTTRPTPVQEWIAALRRTLSTDFDHFATLNFLQHPANRDRYDHGRLRHAGIVGPSHLQAWQELGLDLSDLALPGQASFALYSQRTQRLIEGSSLQRPRLPQERQSLAQVQQFLQNTLQDHIVLDRDAYFSLLQRAAVPPEPIANPQAVVAFHSPLSIYGAHYQDLFWMGAVEGALPADIDEDPMLPFSERPAGLESAEDAAKREMLSVWAALNTAERVVFGVPQRYNGQAGRSTAGQHLQPSLLLGVEVRPAPTEAVSLIERRQAALAKSALGSDRVLQQAQRALHAEEVRRGLAQDPTYSGAIQQSLDPQAVRFSASQLTNFGQCSYQWYAGSRLKLREPRQSTSAWDIRSRGTLFHGALEKASRRAMDAPDFRQAVNENLAQSLEEAYQELYLQGSDPLISTRNWSAVAPALLAQLQKAVAAEDFWSEGRKVKECELRFETIWRGLKVSGIVDRIDLDKAGRPLVVDYKSGSSFPRGAQGQEGKLDLDVQLPMYQEVVGSLYGAPVVGGYYFSIKEAKKLTRKKVNPPLEPLLARLQESFEQGYFAVAPDPKREACKYCDFAGLCRIPAAQDETEGEE